MVIGRRLLWPTLLFFTLLLVMIITYFSVNAAQTLLNEESQSLAAMERTFNEEIVRQTGIALALARQVANNPEVQAAFVNGDQTRLLALTQPAYGKIRAEYRLTGSLFTRASGVVVLDLENPQMSGQNLAANRMMLRIANANQTDLTGLEITPDGISTYGIAPIQGKDAAGETIKGSVSYSLALDSVVLDDLSQATGGDWQLLLTRADAPDESLQESGKATPLPELVLYAATKEKPIFANAATYRKALLGQVVAGRIRAGDLNYSVRTIPLRDFSGRVVGILDILQDRTVALNQLRDRIAFVVLAGLQGLLLGALVLSALVQSTLLPLQDLTAAAQSIADGDLSYTPPAASLKRRKKNEIDRLSIAFHTLSRQLGRSIENLEQLVSMRTGSLEQRTNQLQAAAEIAREVTTLSDVQNLMDEAVNLIRQRFDFYHAGIFLIDEPGEYAVLRAATGEAGRQMKFDHHRLSLNKATVQGIVGAACSSGRPHVAADVESDPSHYKNPLLPETRAEMAAPLRIGARTIGALDVQSRQSNAFDEDDITVIQIIADQLAIAINNANLVEQLNNTVAELQRVQGEITRENWKNTVHARLKNAGYRYSAVGTGSVETLTTKLTPISPADISTDTLRAIQTGEVVEEGAERVSVPIRLRGQTIGAIQLQIDSSARKSQMIGVVEEVSARLGLVLESARLLEEAEKLARREQQINVIGAKLRSSINLENILQNTVRELGASLGVRRATIQLGDFEAKTGDNQPVGNFATVIDDVSPDRRSMAKRKNGDLPDAEVRSSL